MNLIKLITLILPLLLTAQQKLLVGNTKKNILLNSKFKYYVVPFVKSYDDSILVKTNANWQLAFAITINRLLSDSLNANSLNLKQNKSILTNLNNPNKLRELANGSTIIYIDTFKVDYQEKQDYYTYSNKLQIVKIPEYIFSISYRKIQVAEGVKTTKDRIYFIWKPDSGKNWQEIFLSEIRKRL